MKGRLNLCLLVAVVFILAAGCASTQMQLWEASAKGHTDTVKALLEQGADVNAKDNDGFTALMFAARDGQTDTVPALLAKGADVNAKDNDGRTALMRAKKKGHKEIVQLLKKAGAKE